MLSEPPPSPPPPPGLNYPPGFHGSKDVRAIKVGLYLGTYEGHGLLQCYEYYTTKTCLYNFDPFKHHFMYSNTGINRGIHYPKNIDCGYSLEPPRRGCSNEYHNLCFEQKYEKISDFLSGNFHLLVVKFSVYLKWNVFVMRLIQICFHMT